MSVRKLKPITPGTRFRLVPDFSLLTTDKPEKSLLLPFKKSGGRNNTGKMTVRYRGGGHKQRVRLIDFKRDKYDIPATIKSIEYDPMRSAWISLVVYEDGEKRYILYPKDLKVGTKIITSKKAEPEIGNAMLLEAMPIGTQVHNVALDPNREGVLVRSAGASAQIMAREGRYVILKLPSGEIRKVLGACKATVGVVGNQEHGNIILGKAGRKRMQGRRPHTRGVAMNPHDHANGGGEQKGKGGILRSREGRIVTGQKTRNPKKASSKLIINKKRK